MWKQSFKGSSPELFGYHKKLSENIVKEGRLGDVEVTKGSLKGRGINLDNVF